MKPSPAHGNDKVQPRRIARLLAIIIAATMASGFAHAAARLIIRGDQILTPAGAPVQLRGFSWYEDAAPGDAARNVALGANYVRLIMGWRESKTDVCKDPPNNWNDAYDSSAPDGLSPRRLATMDSMIAQAGLHGLWVDLVIRGADCGFWNDPAMQDRFVDLWRTLAKRYRNTPYIGSYEILSEPRPTPNRLDNAPVKALYARVIEAIRSVDPATPIMIGPAPGYNPRNLENVYMGDVPGLIYTANFYEPARYSFEMKKGDGNGGYPGVYPDNKSRNLACDYPGKGQASVTVDKAWMAGLVGCLTSFRETHHVPVLVDQVGVRSATPGAAAWTRDILDILDQQRIGWAYWVYRRAYVRNSPYYDAGDFGILWQDASGAWREKADWGALISGELRQGR